MRLLPAKVEQFHFNGTISFLWIFFARKLPFTTSHLSSSDDLSKIPLRFWQKALIVLNWELLVFIIFFVVALMMSKHAEVVRIFLFYLNLLQLALEQPKLKLF